MLTAPWDEISDTLFSDLGPICAESMAQAGGRWASFEMPFAVVIVNEQEGRTKKETSVSLISAWVAKGSQVRRKFVLLATQREGEGWDVSFSFRSRQ